MAISLDLSNLSPRRLYDAITQLIQGRGNYVGVVTLRAGQTTTVVSFVNCSIDCMPMLYPQTANAAAAVATTYIKAADVIQQQFTITHASSAHIDLTFSFACLGG